MERRFEFPSLILIETNIADFKKDTFISFDKAFIFTSTIVCQLVYYFDNMRQGNILNENIIDCDRYQPKQCSCRRKLHMKNCCKNDKNSSHIRFDRWTKFILVFFILFIVFDNVNAESKRWSIEELQTLTFPYMTTNDLYMDACKAGEFTHVNITF